MSVIGISKPQVTSGPKITPTYPPGMRGLFAWMSVRAPALYSRAMPAIRNRSALSGLGITGPAAEAATVTGETGPVAPSIADKIKDILLGVSQAYLTAEQMKAQKKVLDAQLARAQAGQPPLDIDMSKLGLGPQVSVGLNASTQNILLWVAAGLGAVILIPKLLRR